MATEVARERTALHRTALSRPVTRAFEDGLITEETSVFDYGCGRGGDVARLRKMGIDVAGSDPNYFPDADPTTADVVNLGYVVNVIEDASERAQTLRSAWELTRSILVVSARLRGEDPGLESNAQRCRDGVLTEFGTFQKFFAQDELRDWVGDVTGVYPIAAEPGILYVFREPAHAEVFALTRVRRRTPRHRKSDVVFAEHAELLSALAAFVEDRGRLPRTSEFAAERELRDAVGSPRQAFQIVKNVTGEERWDRVRLARYDDLLVYLALSRFRRRPKLSDLPAVLQSDIKDFFGSYKAACDQGDRALFAIGDRDRVREAIDASRVGKRMPSALYVHLSAIARLPVALRILEGTGSELLGVAPDAAIVKIDRDRPRLSYLEYPNFDRDAHPALQGAFTVDLASLRTDYLDYSHNGNPPILHRKERFVANDYPLRQRFARLTKQEERAGLFADPSRIGKASAWHELLLSSGVELRGHRLVKRR